MKHIAIIPARFASMRFPGKPLAMLGDKTVIQRVYEQVSKQIEETWVATDDMQIFSHVKSWGGNVIMTSESHQSGTDRVEEAVEKLETMGNHYDIVINVQGDEPFVQPKQIESLCKCFDDEQTQIATLGIRPEEDIMNPNVPKIVTDNNSFALYFSRSPIPFIRGKDHAEWQSAFPFMKHIGMYGYRRDVLKEITALPQSSLEKAESLEQLRWLQNGYRIKVGETFTDTIGIDTPEDLIKAELMICTK